MEPKICCRMRGRTARVLSLRRDTRMVPSGYREWHSRAKNLQIRESASGTKLGGGKEAPEIREGTGAGCAASTSNPLVACNLWAAQR